MDLGQAVAVMLSVLIVSGEYGTGMIRLALAATPRCLTVLVAKAANVAGLVLVALFGVGIAAAVRDTAASLGIALGLLYVFPILAQVVSDPSWHRALQRVAPMTAGLAIQATTNLQALAISPWGDWACWPHGVSERCSPVASCSSSGTPELEPIS